MILRKLLTGLCPRLAGLVCSARITKPRAAEVRCTERKRCLALSSTVQPVGNYDLNVIQVALHTSNFETTWVRGSEVSTEALHQAAETGSRGFLLNRPETACCGLWKSNHWYTLTLHVGSWYLLDSRAAAAMPLSAPAAAEHVAALLEEGGHALRVHPAALPAGSS